MDQKIFKLDDAEVQKYKFHRHPNFDKQYSYLKNSST